MVKFTRAKNIEPADTFWQNGQSRPKGGSQLNSLHLPFSKRGGETGLIHVLTAPKEFIFSSLS